jgi:hypothetical protein
LLPTPKSGDLPIPQQKNFSQSELAAKIYEPSLEEFGFSKKEALK